MSKRRNTDEVEKATTSSKQKKIVQKYRQVYSKEWPCLQTSRLGETHVFCTVCNADFSITHGGHYDCRRHIETKKHSDLAKVHRSSKSLSTFFKQEAEMLSATNAEVIFTQFLIEHNLPIAASDHATKLFKQMFPDSRIAEEYSCGRTKTTAIMKTLAENKADMLSQQMKLGPFSVSTDGSNDGTSGQLYPIVVRHFDRQIGRVVTVLLSMPDSNGKSSGENIFRIMDCELSTRNILWENCVSFGSDNASVMIGAHKGVSKFILDKNPSVYIQGCPCHLIHLSAQKGSKALTCNVEEFLIDCYFYLDKSSKRKHELQELQQKYGLKVKSVIKHVSTRWLSLEDCIKRLVELWDPLKEYYMSQPVPKAKQKKQKDSESKKTNEPDHSSKEETKQKESHKNEDEAKTQHVKDKPKKTESQCKTTTEKASTSKRSGSEKVSNQKEKSQSGTSTEQGVQSKLEKKEESKDNHDSGSRIQRIQVGFQDPRTKLYMLFLINILPVFNKANLALQKESPQIHKMRRILQGVLTDLYVRFLTPKSVAEAKDIFSIDIENRRNQRKKEEIVIGAAARGFIKDQSGAGMKSDTIDEFYREVRQFLVNSCNYILKAFPLEKELLLHAEVLDISLRISAQFSSLEYFINRFPVLTKYLQDETGNVSDRLESEFLSYQIDNLSEDILQAERIDEAWNLISLLKTPDGQLKYKLLPQLMLGICVIPHSNADSERIFSQVRKNKTDFRPNLSVNSLSSLMVLKSAMGAEQSPCYEQIPSKELLRKAKSATSVSLKQ